MYIFVAILTYLQGYGLIPLCSNWCLTRDDLLFLIIPQVSHLWIWTLGKSWSDSKPSSSGRSISSRLTSLSVASGSLEISTGWSNSSQPTDSPAEALLSFVTTISTISSGILGRPFAAWSFSSWLRDHWVPPSFPRWLPLYHFVAMAPISSAAGCTASGKSWPIADLSGSKSTPYPEHWESAEAAEYKKEALAHM